MSEHDACREVRASLQAIGNGAQRMAVGHSIVPFVSSRCGGMLTLLDVGMSNAYGGRPAAWKCSQPVGNKGVDGSDVGSPLIRALYEGGEEEPPDLCETCYALRRLPDGGASSVRGGDPHGDCHNYCPRQRDPGLRELWWRDSTQPSSIDGHSHNNVKVEI